MTLESCTNPCPPQCTSSIFDRVVVNYLIRNTTKVSWELLPTFTDPRPFSFTLQVGQTANPLADDWQDVGLPVVDQYFALDPEQRVWGKTNWTHYRVILTTNNGVYYSDPVGGMGTLDRRSWRLAREMVRQRLVAYRYGPGGQRGYLLKRRWTGIPCHLCTDYQTKDSRNPSCPTCFAGKTLVRTESGFKRIDRILIGERVLTIDGTYQQVTDVMRRRYTGKAYLIRTVSMPRSVIVTPEHPFHSLESTHVFNDSEQLARHGFVTCSPQPCDTYMRNALIALHRKSGVNFHKKSGKWCASSQADGIRGGGKVLLGYFDSEEEARIAVTTYREAFFDLEHKLGWVKAKYLGKRKWIDTIYPNIEQDIDQYIVPTTPAKGRKKVHYGARRGATTFIVDNEFLWVVGMYIAEGSSGSRGITFSLHRDEVEYRDRLINFFKKYGFNPAVRYSKTSKGMVVDISSTTLAEWFPKWLGHLAPNKHIPNEFMYLPEDKTRALIQGVWDGDGSKDENSIGQTSEILALQLIELLHRLGEQPLVYRMTKRPGRLPAWVVSWKEPTLKNKNRRGRWHFDNRLLSRINKHKKIDYDDYVYNLEVAGNHTYVVQNVVAHNCYGSGFECGYFFPMGCIWAELSPRAKHITIDSQMRGTVADIVVQADMVMTDLMSELDVIVFQKSDERYYIHNVQHNSEIRGIPIAANVELRPIPYSSIIYSIQIPQQLQELE